MKVASAQSYSNFCSLGHNWVLLQLYESNKAVSGSNDLFTLSLISKSIPSKNRTWENTYNYHLLSSAYKKTSVAVKPAVDRPNHFSLALCKLCLVSILTATDVMDVVNYGWWPWEKCNLLSIVHYNLWEKQNNFLEMLCEKQVLAQIFRNIT